MNKKLKWLSLALCLMAVLCACAGTNDSSQGDDSGDDPA